MNAGYKVGTRVKARNGDLLGTITRIPNNWRGRMRETCVRIKWDNGHEGRQAPCQIEFAPKEAQP